MEERNRVRNAWVLCAAWMAVIFFMSAMSGEDSGEQSGFIVQILLTILPWIENVIPALELFVRKGAHMLEFAVLFFLYRRALFLSGKKHAGVLAFGLTVFYAATDEFHQMFVPGRGPALTDVAIDGCGALLAWGALRLKDKIKAGVNVE